MSPPPPPSQQKKILLGIVAALAALLLPLGVIVSVNDTGSTNPPPGPPTSTVPVPPTSLPPPPPPPAGDPHDACVAPPGMTKLIDQDPSDEQLPWKLNPGENHVTIWYNAPASKGWNAEWMGYVKQAVAMWQQSPCLELHVVQLEPAWNGKDGCPAGMRCVNMSVTNSGDDGNYDVPEKGGYSVGPGALEVLPTLSAKTNAAGCNERRNVVAHEMGHSIGLVHRKARVLMNGDTYADVCAADPDEYKNILFDYGRQRTTAPATVRAFRRK